ncbi:o-succinylbenzoate synthase [Rhodoblastus acidophilus]|uniref:O-succinylbenzoate synthase n=1 Tax=Rhodoblastus acidophilus TaxID=1074 RepID=A0A6N8DK25_RHOAC|nr:enolase C-terminal domain-like protein [Rhodoblastus acidophilus]MCW2274107.1 o-succinylbenzoate synthase [Rhodoblastus acidophilus]MTV30678.1 o-succinylbenzoate synthase [Rhodoblastus acidophilus]
MTLERVVLRPYALPLKQAWRAASATLVERRGMLIGVFSEGLAGWGDCAPLPSSDEPGCAWAFAVLEQAAGALRGMTLDVALDGISGIENAQARWAVETALLELSARQRGQPLHEALGAKPVPRVAVNAAVGALDDGCDERVAAALVDGFSVLKVKVGVGDWRDEARRLRALASGAGRFRLDANRAWSEADAAIFLDAVADLPIDGVEEPVSHPTLEKLRRLQDRYPFALAVDESLFELGPKNLFAARAVRRLVMKPARIGGFRETMRLAGNAAAAGLEVVITSVVDSAVGVAAAAHLAALVAPEQVHGLATSTWLACDVATPLSVRDGALELADEPGLGLAPSGEFAQF